MKKPSTTPVHPSPIRQLRLYEVVAERILEQYVRKAKVGDRLPTEAQFAKVFEVSVPTIREALRSLTQAGFLDRRQGSGTYRCEAPAESAVAALQAASQKMAAIISPLDLTDGGLSRFHLQLALHASKSLRQRGIRSELYFGETAPSAPRKFDDAQLCEDIRAGRISAALTISEDLETQADYRQLLAERDIPVESCNEMFASNGQPTRIDFLNRAVETLASHGRRKIACLGLGSAPSDSLVRSFKQIVARHGAITDDAWIVGNLHPNEIGSGYSLIREMWSTGRIKPDGLLLCDEIFFPDAALAIQELSIRVPEQLVIVSYNNIGVKLVAPFPVVELQFDSLALAEQVAANVAARLLGGETRRPLVDLILVDPLEATAESPRMQEAEI